MGLFKKKAAAAAEAPALDDAAGAATAVDAPPVEQRVESPSALSPAASGGLAPEKSHHSIGDTLYDAKETTVSGVSVAVLILWTIAVTGWTGFQIVQNSLVWDKLQRLAFPKPGSKLVANNGRPGIDHMEIKALWALVAIECGALIFFLSLAIALMWVPYIGACRAHKRARRTKRSFLPWFVTLVLVAAAWFKLFTLSSVLNKMAYQGSWCATNDNLDIKYTFNPGSAPPPTCRLAPMAGGIRQVMVYAMLTIAFHMLLWFVHQPKGTVGKAYGLLPSVLVVAALVLKPVTSMMNVYYTQSAFVKQGNFTFTAEMIVALIEFITAVWLSLYMGWAIHALRLIPRFTNTLLSCCGKEYEDVYFEREAAEAAAADAAKGGDLEAGGDAKKHRRRKSYALRAAAKSVVMQYYMMTQIPSIFGFVSPMITYFALRVTNWWIVFDIIVGAAFVFIYMLLCAMHRKILSPSKH
ncbi:hypothetical protein HT031_005685 [Scenedesmus sp. PABB004]|nr:hypothetical protein HT031_005685 [Scenedesmus sp. PABB004]